MMAKNLTLKSSFAEREIGTLAYNQSNNLLNPISKFIIENKVFLIYFDENNNTILNNILSYHFQDKNIVGEFITNGRRFFIIEDSDIDERSNSSKKLIDILTKREIQIVMLVAEGKVNKQIADHLKISEYTVSTHLRRIFIKLGVDSRAAMIFRCSKLFE